MKRSTKAILRKLALCLLLVTLPACATTYSARSITARVVDAETKMPLEGVVVVAHWQLQGGLEGSAPLGEMMVMDAVTDASGTFHFPAWGPKEIPAGLPSNARLKDFDPQLLLFKRGYQWGMLYNDKSMEQMAHKGPEVRNSDYDGKTVELQKESGSPQANRAYLSQVQGWLQPLEHHCAWKGMPRMMEALNQEEKRGGYLSFVDDLRRTEGDNVREGCGTVAEFLREHEQ